MTPVCTFDRHKSFLVVAVHAQSTLKLLLAGAGIIGPGLTSVNLLASSLLMGGPSLESHFSNLRSLSEDRSIHNTDGSPGSSQRNSIDSNNSDMGVQAVQAQQHAAMVNAGFTVGGFGANQNAFSTSPGERGWMSGWDLSRVAGNNF